MCAFFSPLRQGVAFSGEEKDFLFAKQAFEDEFYDIAKERIISFISNYPCSKDVIPARLYLGRSYFKLNKPERARYEFEYILKRPDSSAFSDEAVYWLAETYFAIGDYIKALEYYQKLIDVYPASPYIAYAYHSKGWCYHKIGENEKAISAFKEMSSKFSHNTLTPKARYMICDILFRDEKLEEAKKEIGLFIDDFPLYSEIGKVYYMRGEIDYKNENFADAISDFKKALDYAGAADWAQYAGCKLALAYLMGGNAGEAVVYFNKCLKDTMDAGLSAAALFGRARALDALERNEEALADYNRLIDKYPSSEWHDDACIRKAEMFAKLGKLGEAERIYKEAIGTVSDADLSGEIRYNLGLIYMKDNNRYDAAVEIFKELSRRSGDIALRVNSLLRMGDIYLTQKRYGEASAAYDTILEKYPDNPYASYAQYKIGDIFYAEAKYDSAILSFRSLFINYPRSEICEMAKFRLAMAFFAKGDYFAAAKNFIDFTNEFPESDKKECALFHIGSSLYNSARYKEALTYFRQLLKQGKDPELVKIALYQIGWCYYQDGKVREATSEFMRFLKIYPDTELSAQILFWFGERFYNTGDYPKAYAYFDKVHVNFPYSKIAGDAAYWKASALYKRGDRVSAIRELAVIPVKYPESDLAPKSILKMGEILVEEGDINGGLHKFEELACSYPKSVFARVAHKEAGEALEGMHSYKMAMAHYRKALTEEDGEMNAEIHYHIAECLEGDGGFKEAAEEYLKVSYLYPSAKFWGIKSEFRCAQIFEKNNEMEKARKIYERLAEEPTEEGVYAKERLAWFKGSDK